ncbi:methionine--tRNA ligase [Cytobacillus purgationiresistens]|uniref:methionine--tRNA ligase n=1 Tax=Cytobacillus purgationiresistens TaxID=863449 RepID=A0ABU0AA95_9BACI|nr:methionine--tRNA ligase [Cytobacillus purgationiresistens]
MNIPVKGFEDKKIYVWIEAVTGYFSASKKWALETGKDDSSFWNAQTKSYYLHGKDNIPFHTVIWPAILLGAGIEGAPTHIVSNEYITVEKKKLSTSKNWAVWVPDIIERYHPDSIRYFLTINAPEERDCDFSWREFIYSHNSELLGAYGNFVNRSLKFIEKYYDGSIPNGVIDDSWKNEIEQLYRKVGTLIEEAHFKRAIETIFSFVRTANKYFDQRKPWIQIKESQVDCNNTLTTCIYFIANLAQVLQPFLPFSSEKVAQVLCLPQLVWAPIHAPEGTLNQIVRYLRELILTEYKRNLSFSLLSPNRYSIQVENLFHQTFFT